jgi:Domain of unknown function (DUF4116)
LKQDRKFVLEAVKLNGSVYQYIDLKYDYEITLEAIKQCENLKDIVDVVPDEMKRYRSIILEVVKKDGLALKYGPEYWRNDRGIVFEAVKQNVGAFWFASDELRDDSEIREYVIDEIKLKGLCVII